MTNAAPFPSPQPARSPQENREARIGALAVLPIFLTLDGRRAVVAGDAPPAAWKAELLAATGAQVDVYAPAPCEDLERLAGAVATVRLVRRQWTQEDLLGAAIAVADCPDRETAALFHAAAKAAGAPANVIDQPDFCDFQFGAIVERSPLVVGISTAGAAPALAQAARARIEAVLPSALRRWANLAAAWRPVLAARALDRTLRRRFWELFAARAMAEADAEPPSFDSLLADAGESGHRQGMVTLVGAGPGDPELLTMKAVRALQAADVVLFDDLVAPEAVAMARREAQRITVGKRGYKPSCTQEDISALLVRLAQEGKRVVRLKGGDPSVFGRANEELNALAAAGVETTVIPGITAASAAAAALRRSLTERDLARRLQFVTAHTKRGRLPDDLDWRALTDARATTAVYMGLRTLPELAARLLAEGLPPDTPAALVDNASRPNERVICAPIGELVEAVRRAELSGPCLVLIGWSLAEAPANGHASQTGRESSSI